MDIIKYMNRTLPRIGILTVLVMYAMITLVNCDWLAPNRPPSRPVITASDTLVEAGSQIELTASSTDPDNDYLTWEWQAPSGTFNNPAGQTALWTSPDVADTSMFEITVNVKDEDGLSANSSIEITVVPDQGSGIIREVVLGQMTKEYEEPFWSDITDTIHFGRYQVLYHGEEIGLSGEVKRISVMPSQNAFAGTWFGNFKIYLCQVNRDTLESNFDDNYEGKSPALAYQVLPLELDAVADEWFQMEMTSDFDYDTTWNLLVEFQWLQSSGQTVKVYGEETGDIRWCGTSHADAFTGEVKNQVLYIKLELEI